MPERENSETIVPPAAISLPSVDCILNDSVSNINNQSTTTEDSNGNDEVLDTGVFDVIEIESETSDNEYGVEFIGSTPSNTNEINDDSIEVIEVIENPTRNTHRGRRRNTPLSMTEAHVPIVVEDVSDEEIEVINSRPAARPLSPLHDEYQVIHVPSGGMVQLYIGSDEVRRRQEQRQRENERQRLRYLAENRASIGHNSNLLRNQQILFQREIQQRAMFYVNRSRRPNLERRYDQDADDFDDISSSHILPTRRRQRPHITTIPIAAVDSHRFLGQRSPFSQSYEDNIDPSVFRNIEDMNQAEIDRRVESELRKSLPTQKKMELLIPKLPGFTTAIEENEDLCCCLCGIVLGEGIPLEYQTNLSKSLANLSLEELRLKCGVQAPWQYLKVITETDVHLSRRIFFLKKCGHVYCGRCFKNIGNKSRRKETKKNKNPEQTFATDSSPYYCVAPECKRKLRSVSAFAELFP